jgi:hypothetical protein
MIVDNLHTNCVRLDPTEANPPLLVDANAVLAPSISGQGLETIPRNRPKVRERRSRVDLVQLSAAG